MAISSNVIYVEPNYTNGYKDSYNSYNENGEYEEVETISTYEMTPPLEDYCIAFQLAVEVPAATNKSTVSTDNTTYILTYENKGDATAVSLLQGTRRPGTDVNYLTTAALETTLTDVRKASPTEMFGVKSIDIEYNSWMTPEITMKFTDIRGASVFVPEELRHPHNGLADDNIPGSFFRCFFVTPYPLFGLVVKGFYGEAVSYELMYSKFTYKLDSSTGNYEAEAKFLGYSWSILADVTLNAVAAAPYCVYGGEEYWNEKVSDGTFTVDDGIAMPKLPQIINAYRNLKEKQSTIPQIDSTVQRNAKVEQNQAALTNIKDNVCRIVSEMGTILKNDGYAVSITQDMTDGFICYLPDNQEILASLIKSKYDELKTQKDSFGGNNIAEFNSTFNFKKDSKDVFKNKKDLGIVCCQITNGKLYYRKNVVSNNVLFDNVPTSTWSKFNELINLKQDDKELYFLVVNLTNWKHKIDEEISKNKQELEESENEMKAKMQVEVANAIGMAPTLYNVMKVIMAHLETLIHCVLKCNDAIPKERTFVSTGLNQTGYRDNCSAKPNKDTTTNDNGASLLPPFPSVKSEKQRDGRTVVEDDWLGDLSSSDELEEVKLIEALLMAVGRMNDETIPFPIDVAPGEENSAWEVPIVPSDLFLTQKIWKTSTWDKKNCAEIIGAIALRATYLMFAMRDCANNASVIGKLDAYNFHKEAGEVLSSQWRDMITTLSDDEFADVAIDLVFNNGLTDEKSKPYILNIPWQNQKMTLLDSNGNPNFPRVKTDTSDIYHYYPVQGISFIDEGFGGSGGAVTNKTDIFALRNSQRPKDRKGETLFKFIGNPEKASKIVDIYENASSNIKDISDYKHFKDNFEKVAKYSKLDNSSYKEMFGSDYKLRTSASENNKDISINNFEPVYDGKLSYTLPESKTDAENYSKSAFNKHGKLSELEDPTVKIDIWNGTECKTVKRDKDDNIKTFFNGSNDISDWTIPFIFGLNEEGKQTEDYSVFSQEPYINAASDYERALMFLLALTNGKGGLDLNDCLKELTKTDSNGKEMFKVVPYLAILLIGGYIFWDRYYDNEVYFRQNEATRTLKHHKSYVTQAFRNSGIFDDYVADIFYWRVELKNYLCDEFVNWVIGNPSNSDIISTNNYISFRTINAELSISNDFNLVKMIADAMNYGTIGNYTTFEKYLASKVNESFFRNYITLLPGSGKEGTRSLLRLYTRENSKIIDKLTGMFIQPVLFVAFNEWLKLDRHIYPDDNVNMQNKIKEYFKGFHKQYSSIIGEDKTEDSSGSVQVVDISDLNKHVKITLYNYIKILYDRWLSAKLFKTNVDKHWGIEEFFEKHFHFIDQFYIDCKDIFFDMEGMVSDFEASFTQETFSLLSFIENALAKTKCVMYPVQNFLNYYDEASAKKMYNLFKPLSYMEAFRDAPSPHQIYPDFVIMYSSEPSSEPSDSECGDSFMLNYDEEFLPYPIRTNPGEKGRIPAFGVTYGKQYQSYFHSIDVGTDTPIPTEQSLKAQYMIAGMSSKTGTENGQQIQCLGQDLYTIYAKQSYTCTVQMMGNMWIQPTMYFVLTNVPTFRGSYMIQKVTHNITPGKMTTTFMGTRMASTTQPHVYNWYMGKNGYSGDGNTSTDSGETRASIDNSCPYKFFTPGQGGDGTKGWTDEMLKSTVKDFVNNPDWESKPSDVKKQDCYELVKDYQMLDLLGYTAYHEGGIKSDLYMQLQLASLFNWYTNGTSLNPSRSIKRFLKSGQIMTKEQANKNSETYQNWLKSSKKNHILDLAREIFINTPAILIGRKFQDKMDKYHYCYTKETIKFTPIPQVYNLYEKNFEVTYDNVSRIASWLWAYEASSPKHIPYPDTLDWKNALMMDGTAIFVGEKSISPKWEVIAKQKSNSLAQQLLDVVDAVQLTCSYSSSINIGKIYSKVVTDTDEMGCVNISVIESMDKPSKENAILFDILINTYSKYLNIVYWVVPNENMGCEFPVKICLFKKKKAVNEKRVLAYPSNGHYQIIKDNITSCPNCKGTLNEYFYRSLAKKYLTTSTLPSNFFSEVDNFTGFQDKQDNVVSLLNTYVPEPCGGYSSSGDVVLLNKCC